MADAARIAGRATWYGACDSASLDMSVDATSLRDATSTAPAGDYPLVRPRDHWYILCRTSQLRAAPLPARLLGTALVLFRDAGGKPAALLDRCAHRNTPLANGRVVDGHLECGYHGWRYDRRGACRLVPALGRPAAGGRPLVPAFAATEQQGFVWVFGRPDVAPATSPFAFPEFADGRYASVEADFEVQATLYDTLENQVDVPHTSVVHAGLFRSRTRVEVPAVVRRWRDRAEVEYREPRPPGLAGRLLGSGGTGSVVHVDRFFAPSVVQVEYRLSERAHVVITNALTPVDDFVTRFWSVVRFRFPLGHVLSRLFGGLLGRRFLAEDADILRLQTDTLRRFRGHDYVSTEADLFGPHIWALLREAERGSLPPDGGPPLRERRVQLLL